MKIKQDISFICPVFTYIYLIIISGTSISSLVNPQCVDFFTGLPSAKKVSNLIILPDIDNAI